MVSTREKISVFFPLIRRGGALKKKKKRRFCRKIPADQMK
jgi:hypothetical protein